MKYDAGDLHGLYLGILSDPRAFDDGDGPGETDHALDWPPSSLVTKLKKLLTVAEGESREDVIRAMEACHFLEQALASNDAEGAAYFAIMLTQNIARHEVRQKRPDIQLGERVRLGGKTGGERTRILADPALRARALQLVSDEKRDGISLTEACGRAELRASSVLGVEISARTLQREWVRDNLGLS
jgi:hypothetical protein